MTARTPKSRKGRSPLPTVPTLKISTEDDSKQIAFTMRQAAEKLVCSERSIWAAINEGRLRAFKIGRSVRISRQSLDAFMEEHST